MPLSVRQLAHDALNDVVRTERESSVDEHGTQFVLGDAGLDSEQRSELRVSILFDDEAEVMVVKKLPDVRGEGESSDPDVVDRNAGVTEQVDRLADGEIAAADGHDADCCTVAPLDDGCRHVMGGGGMFPCQTVHDLLVLVRHLCVGAVLVMRSEEHTSELQSL